MMTSNEGSESSPSPTASDIMEDQDPNSPSSLVCYGDSSRAIMINWMWMACCFAVNHGIASALVALASSELDPELAGLSNGILYMLYTTSALFLATPAVSKTGPKRALFIGMFGFCAYISSFLLATVIQDTLTQWIVVLSGASISGIGAGLLFVAQGQYFESSTELYAKKTNISHEAASGYLAGIFTAEFLGFEMLMKLLASTLQLEDHKTTVFGLFTGLAVASAFGGLLIKDLRVKKDPSVTVCTKITAALDLLRSNTKILLLMPFNLSFGFTSALVSYYSNKYIIKDILQPEDSKQSYVGFAASVIVGAGVLTSLFFGFTTRQLGKNIPMVIGNMAFFALSVSFVIFNEFQLAHWHAVIPLYAVYGVGRGVWESVNKAIYADYFSDKAAAAFANITMQSGFASSLAFFVFPHLSRQAMSSFVIVSSILGTLGFVIASRIHAKEKETSTRPVYDDRAEEFATLIPRNDSLI
eukprot:m.111813 g.111813  ORF g.111813 m.111813 type:complete len:472 (+) comp14072_c0_seq3:244-1659(+)